jgi:hypothetical protein
MSHNVKMIYTIFQLKSFSIQIDVFDLISIQLYGLDSIRLDTILVIGSIQLNELILDILDT